MIEDVPVMSDRVDVIRDDIDVMGEDIDLEWGARAAPPPPPLQIRSLERRSVAV
jgi:hypothetical protein